MAGDSGVDHPAAGTVVDLIAASRGDTLLSWVDRLEGDGIVVSAPQDASSRPVLLPPGEHVDVVWKDAGELRSLPTVLASITPGERPSWRLEPAGVAKRGQRRDAVRAPLSAPVQLSAEKGRVRATTVDLSEGGLRCILEKEGVSSGPDSAGGWAPRAGEVVRLSVMLPDLTISCLAEIARLHPREDARVELSTRFIGLQEHEQDVIRHRVFTRLRELRQRGLL